MSRVAVVTGAGSGIGSATQALLQERGWDVVGIDREWTSTPPDGSFSFDLRDAVELTQTLAGLPRIDALVNNAAVYSAAPLNDFDADTWSDLFRVNLEAAVAAVAASTAQLAERSGAVVNVASVHALATAPGMTAYATSKAALVGFTRAAAVELGPQGIRVNAVLPGAIDTPMLLPGSSEEDRSRGLERLAEGTPLRRIGHPSEIAEAIAFLADGDGSSFITGQSLVADGGVLSRLATE